MSQVAVKFAVPYDQFYRRFGGRKAGNTHGGHNKALNETEDGTLKQYLNFLIYIGKDPNLHTIQQAANLLLRAGGSTRILGRDWSKNWFSRNQKWYKSLRTKTLAAERKASHLTATIESHFSDFRNTQIKYIEQSL
jgi:hypothetical protein